MRVLLCLCYKQPSLLWLHSTEMWQCLHTVNFSIRLIKQQMEDTGDAFADLRWNKVCTSHASSDKWSKENDQAPISLLWNSLSLFILALSAFMCFWTAWYQTVGMITRHSTQGTQGSFLYCLESEQKRSLCQWEQLTLLIMIRFEFAAECFCFVSKDGTVL